MIPEPGAAERDADHHHCITCSDEGVPLTVVALDEERGLALCEGPDGRRSSVEVALVDCARPGTVLLVHAGTALSVLEHA